MASDFSLNCESKEAETFLNCYWSRSENFGLDELINSYDFSATIYLATLSPY